MNRFLRIYMNDQLALGVGWRELAQRSAKSNRGSDLGEALSKVAAAIAEDVSTFEDIMRRLELRANPLKRPLVVIGERMGRLKLNGRVRSYSPLSRFVELDFLTMGIEGKKQLWATLRDLAGLGGRWADIDFDHLIARADQQLATLEPWRNEVGREVLSGDRSSPAQSS